MNILRSYRWLKIIEFINSNIGKPGSFLNKKLLYKYFKTNKDLGAGSFGLVLELCYPKNKCNEWVALKIIWLNEKEAKKKNALNTKNWYLTKKDSPREIFYFWNSWREILVYQKTNQIVLSGICPNFPLSYGYYICPECNPREINHGYKRKISKTCLLSFIEVFNFDIRVWLQKKHSKKEWLSIYFQLVMAIFVLNKKLGLEFLKFSDYIIDNTEDLLLLK